MHNQSINTTMATRIEATTTTTTTGAARWVLRLILLLAFVATSSRGEKQHNNDDDDDVLACHIVKMEIAGRPLRQQHQQKKLGDDDDDDDHYTCYTHRTDRGYRESFHINLSPNFTSGLSPLGGQYLIPGGSVSEETWSVTVPDESLIVRRRQQDGDGDNDEDNDSESMVSWRPQRQRRRERQFRHRQQRRQRRRRERRRRRRKLQDLRLGEKRILAVRVRTMFGEEPAESLDEIEGALFGGGGGSGGSGFGSAYTPAASVVDQYAAMSHGQFTLRPSVGANINKGVAEITMDHKVRGANMDGILASHVLNATLAAVVEGSSVDASATLENVADFIVFCLPDGAKVADSDAWMAFTSYKEPYSFYQQGRCTKLSFVIHEVGHSLGLLHSGVRDDPYADTSGYMGYSEALFGVPRKSYNAHKHWISGWYNDRRFNVDPDMPDGPVEGRLVSFVDYGHWSLGNGDAVLLRIGNLYMHYNRAKGYNIDTPNPFKNTVTVVQANSRTETSQVMALLVTGGSYIYKNPGMEHGVAISVCSEGVTDGGIDYAILSLHLDDGIQQPFCESTMIVTAPPVATPAPIMTSPPTRRPTTPDPTRSPVPTTLPSRSVPPTPLPTPIATQPRQVVTAPKTTPSLNRPPSTTKTAVPVALPTDPPITPTRAPVKGPEQEEEDSASANNSNGGSPAQKLPPTEESSNKASNLRGGGNGAAMTKGGDDDAEEKQEEQEEEQQPDGDEEESSVAVALAVLVVLPLLALTGAAIVVWMCCCPRSRSKRRMRRRVKPQKAKSGLSSSETSDSDPKDDDSDDSDSESVGAYRPPKVVKAADADEHDDDSDIEQPSNPYVGPPKKASKPPGTAANHNKGDVEALPSRSRSKDLKRSLSADGSDEQWRRPLDDQSKRKGPMRSKSQDHLPSSVLRDGDGAPSSRSRKGLQRTRSATDDDALLPSRRSRAPMSRSMSQDDLSIGRDAYKTSNPYDAPPIRRKALQRSRSEEDNEDWMQRSKLGKSPLSRSKSHDDLSVGRGGGEHRQDKKYNPYDAPQLSTRKPVVLQRSRSAQDDGELMPSGSRMIPSRSRSHDNLSILRDKGAVNDNKSDNPYSAPPLSRANLRRSRSAASGDGDWLPSTNVRRGGKREVPSRSRSQDDLTKLVRASTGSRPVGEETRRNKPDSKVQRSISGDRLGTGSGHGLRRSKSGDDLHRMGNLKLSSGSGHELRRTGAGDSKVQRSISGDKLGTGSGHGLRRSKSGDDLHWMGNLKLSSGSGHELRRTGSGDELFHGMVKRSSSGNKLGSGSGHRRSGSGHERQQPQRSRSGNKLGTGSGHGHRRVGSGGDQLQRSGHRRSGSGSGDQLQRSGHRRSGSGNGLGSGSGHRRNGSGNKLQGAASDTRIGSERQPARTKTVPVVDHDTKKPLQRSRSGISGDIGGSRSSSRWNDPSRSASSDDIFRSKVVRGQSVRARQLEDGEVRASKVREKENKDQRPQPGRRSKSPLPGGRSKSADGMERKNKTKTKMEPQRTRSGSAGDGGMHTSREKNVPNREKNVPSREKKVPARAVSDAGVSLKKKADPKKPSAGKVKRSKSHDHSRQRRSEVATTDDDDSVTTWRRNHPMQRRFVASPVVSGDVQHRTSTKRAPNRAKSESKSSGKRDNKSAQPSRSASATKKR